MKIKEKTFVPPLYAVRVHVVVGEATGPELFEHILKKFGVAIPQIESDVDEANAGCCNMKDDLCVIWLRELHARDIDTLTHEVLHAVVEIMRYSGLRFTSASEEAYAYLTGWLNQAIFAWATNGKRK